MLFTGLQHRTGLETSTIRPFYKNITRFLIQIFRSSEGTLPVRRVRIRISDGAVDSIFANSVIYFMIQYSIIHKYSIQVRLTSKI